jgi:hypothetical protein
MTLEPRLSDWLREIPMLQFSLFETLYEKMRWNGGSAAKRKGGVYMTWKHMP